MFENAKQQIKDSLKAENAAKSWLVIGPRGVGKSAFAKELVQELTGNGYDYNPALRWVSKGLTDAAKKEIQKAILAGETPEEKEWSTKTRITVDDVREACQFLSLKSNQIKIVVICLADEMNEEAQNALLKTLEEPAPNTLIMLLCENIGRLLPTILSRCQKVHLMSPSAEDFKAQLTAKYADISDSERDVLAFLSENMMGVAEEIMAKDALEIYRSMQLFLCPTNQLNAGALLDFADTIAKEKDSFDLLQRFLLKWVSEWAKGQSKTSLENAFTVAELYDKVKTAFEDAKALNLDKKQVILSTFYQISEVL